MCMHPGASLAHSPAVCVNTRDPPHSPSQRPLAGNEGTTGLGPWGSRSVHPPTPPPPFPAPWLPSIPISRHHTSPQGKALRGTHHPRFVGALWPYGTWRRFLGTLLCPPAAALSPHLPPPALSPPCTIVCGERVGTLQFWGPGAAIFAPLKRRSASGSLVSQAFVFRQADRLRGARHPRLALRGRKKVWGFARPATRHRTHLRGLRLLMTLAWPPFPAPDPHRLPKPPTVSSTVTSSPPDSRLSGPPFAKLLRSCPLPQLSFRGAS